MMNLFKPKRPTSILGLSLDANRLEAVVVKRVNDSLKVAQSVSVPLALSPLSGDPELVGREIRNHLNQAGIRERRCAVCLPLNWVLTMQSQLPDMEEADVASFLELEAERGFASGHENLYIANSRTHTASGEKFATLIGIPRNHVLSLEKALKSAQLKPVTFSLGITALAASGRKTPEGCLTFALANHGIDLEVNAGGGIAALRSLDGAIENEGSLRRIDADAVAREIRITLGQLPQSLGKEVTRAKIFGRGDMARQFVSDIMKRLQGMGLSAELMERAADAQGAAETSPELAISPALALASGYLRNVASGPEFLQPKVRPWQQLLSAKYSSKKLIWAGSAAGGVVACIILAFLFQSWQISRLKSKLAAIDPTVTELKADQDLIRRFRPFYDNSFRGLRILRQVTQSFPEEGTVSAKTFEIRDLATVTVTGVAQNNQSYISLFDKIRNIPEVSEMKTDMLRGQSPVQFTFNFMWEGGAASGN